MSTHRNKTIESIGHFAETHDRCTANVVWDEGTKHYTRCGKPAVHSLAPIVEWNSWYHECAEHKVCTPSCRCKGNPHHVYTVHTTNPNHSAGTTTITISATGETIKTRSGAPYLLIEGGEVIARAWSLNTVARWNVGGEFSGLIVKR